MASLRSAVAGRIVDLRREIDKLQDDLIWNVGTHDGEAMHSSAIITCEPNTLLEPIHNCMPVRIAEADWPKWLGEEPATSDELRAMLRPFPSEKMSMTPVKRKMPKRGTQVDLTLFVEP